MKYLLVLCLTIISHLIFTQSNTISVRGQAHYEVKHIGIAVEFKMTEIERNDYQKIRQRSTKQILEDLVLAMKEIGYPSNALEEPFPPYNYFARQKMKVMKARLSNIEELQQIMNLEIRGLTVQSIHYEFAPDDSIDNETQLTLAVEDANTRAMYLAKVADKKLGKVISLSSSVSNANSNNYHTKKPVRHITHTVTVNYELLNQ